MKKLSLLFLLLILASNGFSQELKKVSKKSPYYSETYYVLKGNKIKHGRYVMMSEGDTIKSGFYTNDKKTGNWRYYIGKDLEFVYDYDLNKIVSDTPGKARTALFSEGFSYFLISLASNLKYPAQAVEKAQTGSVEISFKVEVDGSVSDFIVYTGCGNNDLNEEALRVVEKVARQAAWYPAINFKGIPVSSTVTRIVNFHVDNLPELKEVIEDFE